MKVLNFGSLNIDNVCRVENFVRPGETLSALDFTRNAGGKGLNQSIALARAGVEIFHAGRIGGDGEFLRELLERAGVDCSCLVTAQDELTGCAMIQVSAAGENCIVLFGGANMNITCAQIKSTLDRFSPGDILLLQNEISRTAEIMTAAAAKGMRIFINPAPMNSNVRKLPLDKVDTFIVNELEAAGLAGMDGNADSDAVIASLQERFPATNILMTLGSRGAVYAGKGGKELIKVPACKVEKVVDTTAAGDTFTGFFISGIIAGKTVADALDLASRASAYCIARAGAAVSIPALADLDL